MNAESEQVEYRVGIDFVPESVRQDPAQPEDSNVSLASHRGWQRFELMPANYRTGPSGAACIFGLARGHSDTLCSISRLEFFVVASWPENSPAQSGTDCESGTTSKAPSANGKPRSREPAHRKARSLGGIGKTR